MSTSEDRSSTGEAARPLAPPTTAPEQGEMPFAIVMGKAVTELPKDLYIPPRALEVILEAFEGPLDLLLYLIRRAEVDIHDIPIVEITDQYLDAIAHLDREESLDIDAAGGFLAMWEPESGSVLAFDTRYDIPIHVTTFALGGPPPAGPAARVGAEKTV